MESYSEEKQLKIGQCRRLGWWIGGLSGCCMGLFQIYWSVMDFSGIHGSLWMNLATGLPASVIGAFAGVKITDWITRRIISGNPKIILVALKGIGYGTVAGVVIGIASVTPLLVIGHYMGTIQFNMTGDLILLRLLGTGALGGGVFGGMIGAAAGFVYGPAIMWYINHSLNA